MNTVTRYVVIGGLAVLAYSALAGQSHHNTAAQSYGSNYGTYAGGSQPAQNTLTEQLSTEELRNQEQQTQEDNFHDQLKEQAKIDTDSIAESHNCYENGTVYNGPNP